jgi:hypothetical protein
MTIHEKLEHIESVLAKVRLRRDGCSGEGWVITKPDFDLTNDELDVVEAALEVAAGICTLFKDRS